MTMKDPQTSTTAIPRSATLRRFRPLSLPVYLDYKLTNSKRRPAAPVEPPTPQRHSIIVPAKQHGAAAASGFSAIPRMLRPTVRASLAKAVYHHPQQNESRCCQMLIHGLFVAFEDDFVDSGVPKSEDLRADGGKPFTHFISLSARYKTPIKQLVDRKTGVKRLRLGLPRLYSTTPPTAADIEAKVRAARDAAAERGVVLTEDDYYDVVFDEGESSRYTSLEALQLLAARDFLFGSGLREDSRTVRVLVTTPRDHRTDAVAAVTGYLSLVLGCSVAKVLHTQDHHPKVLNIWKDTISEECAEYIEDVCVL
ncbi:hypothetical protein B0H15DRAFT_578450 [Mycena belliarum]|uniref:Uncharacterized protein n=1 Tax=Mycena belliarum TaxID=1033014 RepID=A0AAD6TR85_9AGAR|nr:hypothetical protein B0H15DRAFT_578450 [Mycena belliae]